MLICNFVKVFWKLFFACGFTFCHDYFIFMFVRCVCLLSNYLHLSTHHTKSQYLLCLYFAQSQINRGKTSQFLTKTVVFYTTKPHFYKTLPSKNTLKQKPSRKNILPQKHPQAKNPQPKGSTKSDPVRSLPIFSTH